VLIESERCDNCGKTYDTVYGVDDATWDRFAGSNMCLCPACADKLARGKGLSPYWEMKHGEYPTQALKTENDRLKEALRGCVRIGESLGCTDPDCRHVSCAMLKKAREVLEAV
jgi:hypothetical protein